jgi:hypothetical protein
MSVPLHKGRATCECAHRAFQILPKRHFKSADRDLRDLANIHLVFLAPYSFRLGGLLAERPLSGGAFSAPPIKAW